MLFDKQKDTNCRYRYDNVGSGKIFDLLVLFKKRLPFLPLAHSQFHTDLQAISRSYYFYLLNSTTYTYTYI